MTKLSSIGSFLVVIMLISCSTSKISKKSHIRSDAELLDVIAKSKIDHNWFFGQGVIEATDSPRASLTVKLKKDSLTILDIRKFSIPVASVLLDNDNFILVNRLEKYIEQGPIAKLKSFVPFEVTHSMAQDMIIGNLPFTQNIKPSIIKEGDIAILMYNLAPLNIKVYVNQQQLLIDMVEILHVDGQKATIYYSGYKKVSGQGLVAFDRRYVFEENELYINYTHIELGSAKPMNFNVPSSYEQK